MHLESYDLERTDTIMTFEFISKGPKGAIRKRVQFEKIKNPREIYNLAFGDVNLETNEIDDTIVSNNDDTQKILATVAKAVSIFTKKFPNAYIHAEGSTLARTRLYQMGIAKNFEEIDLTFNIRALSSKDGWVHFEKNNNYLAFLIRLKH